MSYNPTADFLALQRQTAGGVAEARVPGLDFVVAALARAGLIQLSVGQAAPTTNQSTTAWFKPALPSWTAEGVMYLWNSATSQYEVATALLWISFLTPPPSVASSGYVFQLAGSPANTITAGTSLLAVERVGPATTVLTLPNLAAQALLNRKLQIVDFSTSITIHTIVLNTSDGATIMQRPTWQLRSTADQLAGIMLQPSSDLNSWVIAP